MLVVPSNFSIPSLIHTSRILSHRTWLLLFGLIWLGCAQVASAQTFTVPATSTTGSFTISWAGGAWSKVEEFQGGAWVTVASSYGGGGGGGSLASSGSLAVTKTTGGTYTYRLETANPSSQGIFYSHITKNIAVTFSIPECVLGTGNTTSYCYDVFGRVTSVRHPNGVVNSYTYDAADNRTKKVSN